MFLGQVSNAISAALYVPSATMVVVTRSMRQAGHVAVTGRGRSAHHVTDLELARIVIAVMASESPAEAVRRYAHFAALPIDQELSRFAKPEHLPKVETFELGLAAVFTAARKSPQIALPKKIHPDRLLSEQLATITLNISQSSASILLPQDDIALRYEWPNYPLQPPFFTRLGRKSELVGEAIARLARLGT